MKRFLTSWLILAAAVCYPLPTPAQSSEQTTRDIESQAYKLAEKLLDGRQIVVRVWRDWQTNPASFELVRVPLRGLTIELDSIKSALGQISDSAFVAVLGEDQKDRAVAVVAGDFINGCTYKDGKKLPIWPPRSRDVGQKWWIFVDALGSPIPQATVEIRLHDGNCDAEVSLYKAQLDEKGRLKHLREPSYPLMLIFTISHPNYGTASVKYYGGPSNEDSPDTYVVPLVPKDSEAASRSVRGFVVDNDGNAIEGALISCGLIYEPNGKNIDLYTNNIVGQWITDQQGWFAMYLPIKKNGALSNNLIPLGSKYSLSIMPPKHLNLRGCEEKIPAGAQTTIILTSVSASEYFHTFVFEDRAGLITDIEELKKITITLHRVGRGPGSLKYDAWKDGRYLPIGTLRATTNKWGYPYSFEPIGLTPDSPENLVFRPYKPIYYKGRVVHGVTSKPMPGVLVLANHYYSGKDPCSLTPDQWERLRAEAAKQTQSPSDKTLHNNSDRITVTDANGCYALTFMPGWELITRSLTFTAFEKDYVAEPISTAYSTPGADRVVEVQTIKLLPAGLEKPAQLPKPTFVFENESGPVTDPNLLSQIQIKIRVDEGATMLCPYDELEKNKRFDPGTYYATADWNGKYYIFEPVNLPREGPQTVFFKLKEIKSADIIFRGQVIHGITDEPIPGAIVMCCYGGAHKADASQLEPEQWDAIRSIGPQLNPDDPALIPLKYAFQFTKITRADLTGRFQIAIGRGNIRKGTFTSVIQREGDTLIAIQKDYLGVEQQLEVLVSLDETDPNRQMFKKLEPDQNDFIMLPPMKLFPAGTIIINPNIPDLGSGKKYEPRLYWLIAPDDATPWRKDLLAAPRDNKGASTFYKYDVRPNEFQTVYIPAGLKLTIKIYEPLDTRWVQVVIPGIKVEQGQILDLGRRDFQPAFKVAAKVIDSKSKPVEGVAVRRIDGDGTYWGQTCITNADGIALVYVAPHSKGKFVVEYVLKKPTSNNPTYERLEESTPFEVAGEEDARKEFTLQLSDEILSYLLQQSPQN